MTKPKECDARMAGFCADYHAFVPCEKLLADGDCPRGDVE